MTSHFVALSHRIQQDLVDIERATTRVQSAWQAYVETENDFLLDSVALNLHGFYNGLERLFERIAKGVDNRLLSGSNWHQALLKQMATEVTDARPKVISDSILKWIDEYRRFRHVVRNVYGYDLDPDRLIELVGALPDAYNQVKQALVDFSNWLDSPG